MKEGICESLEGEQEGRGGKVSPRSGKKMGRGVICTSKSRNERSQKIGISLFG